MIFLKNQNWRCFNNWLDICFSLSCLGMQIWEVERYLKVDCFLSKVDNSFLPLFSWNSWFSTSETLCLLFWAVEISLPGLFSAILCLITRGTEVKKFEGNEELWSYKKPAFLEQIKLPHLQAFFFFPQNRCQTGIYF